MSDLVERMYEACDGKINTFSVPADSWGDDGSDYGLLMTPSSGKRFVIFGINLAPSGIAAANVTRIIFGDATGGAEPTGKWILCWGQTYQTAGNSVPAYVEFTAPLVGGVNEGIYGLVGAGGEPSFCVIKYGEI